MTRLKPSNKEHYFKQLMDCVVQECVQVEWCGEYVGRLYTGPCDCCYGHGGVTILQDKADFFWRLLPIGQDVQKYMSWYNARTRQSLPTP